jgi:hypothetical protein
VAQLSQAVRHLLWDLVGRVGAVAVLKRRALAEEGTVFNLPLITKFGLSNRWCQVPSWFCRRPLYVVITTEIAGSIDINLSPRLDHRQYL